YSTLLNRSIDFNQYLDAIRIGYPDPLDQQLLIALAQQLWDRAEPQGYMTHLRSGDLSNPPVPHKVLMHMGTYDCEVSNVATEIMVRSLGISQLTPVHRSFFDIPEQAAVFDDSVFVEVDPMRGFSRCDDPGGDDPGAACMTDADCPGAGDPPTRTACHTGIPPLNNTPPFFNNGAHGSTRSFGPAGMSSSSVAGRATTRTFRSGPPRFLSCAGRRGQGPGVPAHGPRASPPRPRCRPRRCGNRRHPRLLPSPSLADRVG